MGEIGGFPTCPPRPGDGTRPPHVHVVCGSSGWSFPSSPLRHRSPWEPVLAYTWNILARPLWDELAHVGFDLFFVNRSLCCCCRWNPFRGFPVRALGSHWGYRSGTRPPPPRGVCLGEGSGSRASLCGSGRTCWLGWVSGQALGLFRPFLGRNACTRVKATGHGVIGRPFYFCSQPAQRRSGSHEGSFLGDLCRSSAEGTSAQILFLKQEKENTLRFPLTKGRRR